MASGVLQNTSNQTRSTTESKNKKKKGAAKNLEAPPVSGSKDSSALNSPRNGPEDTAEASGEKEHIREALKQIRNVNKKLNSMQKVDAIIKENPNVSLDDLVESRKINADQRAQALKKPQLQSQLASLEEQLALYRKIESDYQTQIAKEKDSQLSSHVQELEKIREETRAETAQEAKIQIKNKILTFSRFLAAAANRRNQGEDTSPEGRAFEGALLLVYGGDVNAVEAAEKIIDGSKDYVIGVDGSSTDVTFQRVRELTLQEIPLATETPWDHHSSTRSIETDPTIANAGLTELEDPTTAEMINGTSKVSLHEVESAAPPATSIDAGAANAAADSQWDPSRVGTQEDPLSESFEMIPRETGDTQSSTPVAGEAAPAKQSWSDVPGGNSFSDIPSMGSSGANGLAASSATNDGFHEVKHHHGGRGRSHGGAQRGDRGRGGQQGGQRRGGGGFRGGERGERGERGGQRGSGRGGYRPRGRGD